MKSALAFCHLGFILRAALCGAVLASGFPLTAQPSRPAAPPISLRECLETALVRNRTLQIERINPVIAQLALQAAYGYYDPVFATQVQQERDTDTGGFDPTDFSRDAIYSARSEVANASLGGWLPSGLSYTLTGAYAHSDGVRNGLDFDSYKLVSSASARQPLLRNFWTDQGRTQIRVNKKRLQISELGVAYVAMDTINQVQQAYYELLFTQENLQVRQRLLATKAATLAGIQRQVAVGTMTILEEKLALSAVARVQADLVAASNTVVLAENALKTLLGHSITNWDDGPLQPADRLLVVPEPLALASSWHYGLTHRPDLAQLKADLERSDLELKFYYNQLFPSLDLVAGYGRRGASAMQTLPPRPAEASLSAALDQVDDGTAPNHMVGILFSTPLSRARERANHRAGKQLKEQALLRLQQKQEWILREISDALHTAQSARERVQATQRARDSAQAALEAEERKLAGGTSSLFFVLQLQSDLADVQSAEVRARADYNRARSQLHFAEGSLLERNQMVIDAQ